MIEIPACLISHRLVSHRLQFESVYMGLRLLRPEF